MTERLDRAILAACRTTGTPINDITAAKRRYAQALIADFLKPNPPAPIDPDAEVITLGPSADWGHNMCLAMLRERAGLPEETEA